MWRSLLLVGGASLFGQLLNRSGKDSTIFISGQVFLPNYPIGTCTSPWGVAVADFSGDQWEDIVVACRGEAQVILYLNNQKAEFPRQRKFPTLKDPWRPLALDLNYDGAMDVVLCSYSEAKVAWHHNDKRGNLPLTGSLSVGKGPHHLITGDWNGDGRTDVGVVCYDAGNLHLLTTTASGGLSPYKVLAAPIQPRTAAVGDLDRDGKPDIVIAGEEPSLLIYYGKNGYTGDPQRISVSPSIWAIDIGDIDKDKRPDIVAATYTGSLLITVRNAGYGRWDEPRTQPSGNYNFALYLGDFDKDGDLDAVTVSARDHVINVHLNDGKGNFSDRHRIGTGNWPISLTLADVNGDESVDFITTSLNDNSINIHRNVPVNPPKPVLIVIQGRLIDGDTGEEVEGNVTLIDTTAMERAGSADEAIQGQRYTPGKPFRFQVTGGRHNILLRGQAPGYPPAEVRISIPPLKQIPDSILQNGIHRDLVLRKVQRLKVYGYVTDAAKKTPLAQASVTLLSQEGVLLKEVTTNEKGYYEVEIPLGLNHRIQAAYAGYEPAWQVFSLTRDHYPQGLRIDLALTASVSRTCIEGLVQNQVTRQPVAKATLMLIHAETGTRRPLTASPNGAYKGCLPPGKYYIEIIHKGFFPYKDSVFIPESGLKQNFLLAPVEAEKAIVLRNIYFDYDKATLRPESIEELERVVRFLQENPTLRVEISGHTDSDGSEMYNLRLSQARAQAVVDYLVSRGISPSRLVAKGYGKVALSPPTTPPKTNRKIGAPSSKF
jgi:outer membrane protein OmpA-like peptidoglycan-associated protein